ARGFGELVDHDDHFGETPTRLARRGPFLRFDGHAQELEVCAEDGERIVDLVGDRLRELVRERELLRANDLVARGDELTQSLLEFFVDPRVLEKKRELIGEDRSGPQLRVDERPTILVANRAKRTEATRASEEWVCNERCALDPERLVSHRRIRDLDRPPAVA